MTASKNDRLEEMEKSIEQITLKIKNNMTNIIVIGDLNLPKIHLDNTTVKTNPQYDKRSAPNLLE